MFLWGSQTIWMAVCCTLWTRSRCTIEIIQRDYAWQKADNVNAWKGLYLSEVWAQCCWFHKSPLGKSRERWSGSRTNRSHLLLRSHRSQSWGTHLPTPTRGKPSGGINREHFYFYTPSIIYAWLGFRLRAITFLTVATHIAERLRGSIASNFMPSLNHSPLWSTSFTW